MTGFKSLLMDYAKKDDPMEVFGDNNGRAVVGVGTFECDTVKLKDMFYVEGLKGSFISISQLCDTGYKVHFDFHEEKVFNSENKIELTIIFITFNTYIYISKSII